MRLMRREYMKILLVDNLSEDGGSESGESQTVISESNMSGDLQVSNNDKRLKEVTVKHILENF
jgi:hypothetical protein